MKSQICQIAHQIKKSQGVTISQAMKYAWAKVRQANINFAELQKNLKNGIVEIIFQKSNGEITSRLATKVSQLIPQAKQPKGTGKPKPSDSLSFFSLTDSDWRQAKLGAILQYNVELCSMKSI